MAVSRSEIADVESLEDVLLMADSRFHCIAQSDDALAALVFEHTFLLEPACRPKAQAVVRLVGVKVDEILLHAADGAVNGHVVVVEDDEEVVGRRRCVVESFEGESARHGSIADDGDDMPLGVALETCCHSHSQGRGDAVRRMSAGEGVVFALER